MDEMTVRAISAYYRFGRGSPPPGEGSGPRSVKGKRYIVLRNAQGLLAVYRVRNDGMLKRLKRWPESIGAREMAHA